MEDWLENLCCETLTCNEDVDSSTPWRKWISGNPTLPKKPNMDRKNDGF